MVQSSFTEVLLHIGMNSRTPRPGSIRSFLKDHTFILQLFLSSERRDRMKVRESLQREAIENAEEELKKRQDTENWSFSLKPKSNNEIQNGRPSANGRRKDETGPRSRDRDDDRYVREADVRVSQEVHSSQVQVRYPRHWSTTSGLEMWNWRGSENHEFAC